MFEVVKILTVITFAVPIALHKYVKERDEKLKSSTCDCCNKRSSKDTARRRRLLRAGITQEELDATDRMVERALEMARNGK